MKKLKLLLSSSLVGISAFAPIMVMSASVEAKTSHHRVETEVNDIALEQKRSELYNLLAKKTMYGATKEYYSMKVTYSNSVQELLRLQKSIENEPKHSNEEYPEIKDKKVGKTFIITTSVLGSVFIIGLLAYPIIKLISKLRNKRKNKSQDAENKG